MPVSTSTAAFATLLAPGLRKVFFDEIDRQPNQWMQVLNIDSSDRAYEDDAEATGLGAMVPKPEGVNIEFTTPIMGGTKRYTPSPYGIGWRVTREMWDDDLYSIINKMPAEIGKSVSYRVEIDAWDVFNEAFNSSANANFLGLDGLPLCHVSHTRLDGGAVRANKPSTDVDFSATAYQASLDHFKQLVDERGRPITMTPGLIIVDPTFEWAVKEIIMSPYVPYSSNNEINVLKSDGSMEYLLSRYLSDADSWFNISADHDLNFIWRVKPETSEADDFLSGDALYKAYCRYAVGFSKWLGVYGSSGGS
jgi:hypothetical protein